MARKSESNIKKSSVEIGHLELSKKYVAPEIIEDKFRGYVLNGKNNSYFDYVNERRVGSPTNSAIISNYIKLIYGQGLFDRNNQFIQQYISKSDVKKSADYYYSQGMTYLEVIKKRNGDLARLKHFPLKWLAPEIKNEKNEVTGYYFLKDWSKAGMIKPEYIPAFGFGNGTENEILCIRDFQYDQDYFALPKFQSVLQYAQLEEEISNYSLNHIKKGLAFGYIINIPNSSNLTDEEKRKVKSNILKSLSGSDNAGATVFNFMTGDGDIITVEVIQQNASHKQWEALRDQAREQIIVGHEVVSPLLFGINRGSGLSSTKDEMEEAEDQTMRRVIKPLQQVITDALEDLFITFGIYTNLYFMGLSESREVELKKEYNESEIADLLINSGEDKTDEYESIFEEDADGETENEFEALVNSFNQKTELADVNTGTAFPNANSRERDEKTEDAQFKVRYEYSPNKVSANSREFCRKMVNARKIYRREDLERMSNNIVNPGFGAGGTDTYDIFKFKGGARCRHRFIRKVFMKKDPSGSIDVKSPIAERLITSLRTAKANGYSKGQDPDYNTAKTRPVDMPNEGFLNPR